MLDFMFALTGIVVGVPIFICISYLVYDFFKDVLGV